jgi:hypothetical protein
MFEAPPACTDNFRTRHETTHRSSARNRRRSSRMSKRRGSYYEHRAKRRLEAQGYRVTRAAGSLGTFDSSRLRNRNHSILLTTSEVVPHVPAHSAPIDADASTKESEIFHVGGRSAPRTTRRHICARIGVPTTATRPFAAVTECTTIRFSPEHSSRADRVPLMKRTRRLSSATAKRPMLAQTTHVLVEASRHANERQRIRVAAIAAPWRGLRFRRLVGCAAAGLWRRTPLTSVSFLAQHARANRRSDAILDGDKRLAITRDWGTSLARTRTLWTEFTRLRAFVGAAGGHDDA